jgi:hypothetical protein
MSVWAKILTEVGPGYEAGQDLADGDLLYMKSDGKVYKADANGSSTYPCIGAAGVAVSSGDYVSVVFSGWRNDGISLTIGGAMYLSQTAGAATQTATGTTPQQVGFAMTATNWYFQPAIAYNVPN